jgi:hypothetical protein
MIIATSSSCSVALILRDVKHVFVLAGLLLLATGCGATPQDGIRAAIRSSPDTETVRSQGLTLQVSQIRVAQSDAHFATATVHAYDPRGHRTVNEAFAILRRTDRWHVVELGTAVVYLSCDQTPRPVVMELFGGWCFGARGALNRLR